MRKTFTTLAACAATALLALAPCAPAQAQQALACLILPAQVVDVGSPVVGVLERVEVERGQMVKKGQVLAQLTSDVERANRAVAQQRLNADAELQSAMANQEYLKRRVERSESLVQQNFISPQAHDQVATEGRLAERRVSATQQSRAVIRRELELADAQLAQRFIRSPIDGVVVERYLNGGERVEEKAVVKVAAVDPLRVEVVIPSKHFFRVQHGMNALVTPDLPDLGPLTATVQSMDRVVDAASNTFRVRLSLPNPDHKIPAGLRCKIALGLDAEDPAPAKQGSSAAALKMSTSLGAGARNGARPSSAL